jgi:sugar phosphate isomerase/epimerase
VGLVLGYNTNGFAHHELLDALDILAGIGYRAVGLTLDVHHAPPGRTDYARLGEELRARSLLPVVETGARFLLDPRHRHQPTLLSAHGRQRRLDFLLGCVDIAATIGAPCVSLWSGPAETEDPWGLLVEGLERVCDRADAAGVDVAFEPEPGMWIDSMEQFDRLREACAHPRLRLTLDIGHLFCVEEEPPEVCIDRYADLLCNVHLDDHRRGLHEHLAFGEGEMDVAAAVRALQRVAAERDLPATVELSRHGHDAVATARRAFAFLSSLA